MKLKAIHIDDDPESLKHIRRFLEANPNINYLGGFTSFKEVKPLIEAAIPDILFLDIELNYDSGNIFELLKDIEIKSQLVFISGYNHYASEAYHFNATDYLLKPTTQNEIETAIEKVQKNILINNVFRISELAKHAFISKENKKAIAINSHGKLQFIEIDKVTWIEANGSYSIVNLIDETNLTSSKSLKYFRNILENSAMFIEISRSVLVNMNHITSILREKHKNKIQMSTGELLEISQLNRDRIIEKIKNFKTINSK